MGKDPIVIVPPSFPRFILWETVGIVGFFHILLYGPPNDPTPLFFLANALVFTGLYPVLYFYNQMRVPVILKFLIRPLGYVLRLLLMISSFLWITYILYATGFSIGMISFFQVVKNDWMFLAPFFALDYFLFLEHMWGLSEFNFSFWSSLGMISDSVSGVVGGFIVGRILFTRWSFFQDEGEIQGVIWAILILAGIAAVVWFGNKTRRIIVSAPEAPPTPSLAQFIFWEIVGVLGFFHILIFSSANDPTHLYFLSNMLVFVVLYPVLYFYNQLYFPAVLKFLVLPLSITLRLVLLISSFIGIAYLLYAIHYSLGTVSVFQVVKDYWIFLVPFFVINYFWLLEHLWGLSRVNFAFWSSVGMVSDSVSGIVSGYALGRTLNTKWGIFFGDDNIRALIWIIFILIGLAAVVWFGHKTRKG